MSWDSCVDFCTSHQDRPLQIESVEKAELFKNFIIENCPYEKVWMGYLTEDKTHKWLNKNLKWKTPVPQGHVDGTKSIGCKYFDHKDSNAVPYIKISSKGSVECKVHSNDPLLSFPSYLYFLERHEHEHNCVCMRHINL